MDKINKIKEISEKLNEASDAYYNQNTQIMTDYEYDKLYDELLQLEKETGIILSNSPTQKVGFTVLSELTKVTHEHLMLSLDKTKEISKLTSFIDNKKGLLSWKLDGLTCVLKYREGKLIQALTRGNGEVGEDITHNAKVFKNIPIKISSNEELTIRGEAIITFSDFERINQNLENDDKYKNTRNLCSGTVRQLNSEITSSRNVKFYAFSLVTSGNIDFNDSKENQLIWLKRLGFEIVEYKISDKDNIENEVEYFKNKISNEDFATDGLVLTFDSISYSESLGVTSKFPKDSIAFKWADEIAETILIDVEWNTSRTGLINPIAIFEPVHLEGTTVNKASLHNVSIFENLKLGIGDRITVYKANMIIPQVAENLTKSATIQIPDKCLVCEVESEIIKLKEGKALYCTNPNCKAQLIRSLSHYTSRDAANIEGLSEATIEKFVEKGFLENYTDLYNLHKYKNIITEMEGFGEKSYNKLEKSIEKSKEIALPNFIYALGINHVGLSNAKLLCKYFNYDLDKIMKSTTDELIEIDGFGAVISHALSKYFSDEKNKNLIQYITSILKIQLPTELPEEKRLNNFTFVITGDVFEFENRKELQKYIENSGGKVTSSVTGKTSYLINNDLESNSSKNKKAKELGIPIINEKKFIEMFSRLVPKFKTQ